MVDLDHIAHDLHAEHEDLDAIVSRLNWEQWHRATSSSGWTVADQIGHLTYFDGAASAAIVDPQGFAVSSTELAREPVERIEAVTLHRDLEPIQLLGAWRDARRALESAIGDLDESTRVPWYGPDMSAKSFLTARLMETWAHGQDVVDAVGMARSGSDRLRHIAQLGYATRRWAYINRHLNPPEANVRLELQSPVGELWTWGPTGVPDLVQGTALDFCLVVTQRRNVADTQLRVRGVSAQDWLNIAQAFAGPPTDPPERGAR